MCVCVCVYIVIVKNFLVFEERFLAPCFVEFYCQLKKKKREKKKKVNDEPESKFLYTETIKLYCIVPHHRVMATASAMQSLIFVLLPKRNRLAYRITG